MKILVDCRYVRLERHDGISRYTVGLAAALARLTRAGPERAGPERAGQETADPQPAGRHRLELLVSDVRQLAHLPAAPWHLISAPTSVREPFVARQVRRLHPDVVFTPMQTMGGWGRDYPLVVTLHDLIYHHHRTPPRELPGWLRLLWRAYHLTWWPQRLLLGRADAVVTVSATTAAQIARHRLARRPAVVVPNAADPADPADPADLDRPRARALVYMGSFMPYKDVGTLARAVADLPDHELHLMSRVYPAQRARLDALAGPGRLVFHDGASEETYRSVLRSATALLSASREEGFGIPLVEAMSVGTPVVVSDIAVFREVCGDAALYVRTGDAAGFAAAVRGLADPGAWHQRSAACRERAATFSWDASARVLLPALEAAARGRSHR